MPIEGWYRPKHPFPSAPYIQAAVYLPRLGVRGLVHFLVDTGADKTILHPADIDALRIDLSMLDPNTLSQSYGVGGSAQHYQERATLYFGRGQSRAEYWSGNIDICDISQIPADKGNAMPSLLGRDFLNLCHLVASPGIEQLVLSPYRTDSHGRIIIP